MLEIIINLASAVVSEIFISDCEDIQPVNRLTVEAHRQDELAHGNIFKHLTKCIYRFCYRQHVSHRVI